MAIKPYENKRRNENPSPSGSKIEPIFSYVINKQGQRELQKTGEYDIDERIQMYAEDTKIENVIQKVIQGDTSMLRPSVIYEDTTTYPNSLIESMERVNDLFSTYDNLPEEVKQKYPTVEKWIQKAGTEEWLKDNGYTNLQPIQTIEKLTTEETTIGQQVKEMTPNE